MSHLLDEKDIKELRLQCRMGIILPALLFIIINVATVLFFVVQKMEIESSAIFLSLIGSALLTGLLSYLMNRKYWSDIKNCVKTYEIKTISGKEIKNDYEAGSGAIDGNMNAFYRYDLIIENTRYRVERELFENCVPGDEVVFFYGPKSRLMLQIELKKNIEL